MADLHKNYKKKKIVRKIERTVTKTITTRDILETPSKFRFSRIPKMRSSKLRKPLLTLAKDSKALSTQSLLSTSVSSKLGTPSAKNISKKRLYNPSKCFTPIWTKKTTSTTETEDSADYSLISYNVLAQHHLEAMKQLYKHNLQSALKWEKRWSRFQDFITCYPSDIYCLQEVQKSYLKEYTNFFESLPEKMLCVYTQRPGGKPDGCLIAYNYDKLDLLERVDVDYSITNPFPKVSDNIGQIVVLTPTDHPDRAIIIANTHLLYNPKNGEIKFHQITMLLHRIQVLKSNYEDLEMQVSCFLCGDLNSSETSGICQFLRNGTINTENWTRFNLSDQREARPAQSLAGEINGIPMNLREYENSPIFTHTLNFAASVTNDECKTVYTQTAPGKGLVVDHIFSSNIEIVNKLSMWPKEKYNARELPGNTYGSDHMPVGVQFNLAEK